MSKKIIRHPTDKINPELRPIETSFCGCKFRSRLEARWAVFFETLGLKWEYEPEGFQLDDDIFYLPDFRVNNKIWIEIKPHEDLTSSERSKILAFGIALNQQENYQPYYVVCGQPWPEEYHLWQVQRIYEKIEEKWQWNGYKIEPSGEVWTHCPLCQTFDIRSYYLEMIAGEDTEALQCMYCDIVDRNWKETDLTWFHKGLVLTDNYGFILTSPVLRRAYHAARSARFS